MNDKEQKIDWQDLQEFWTNSSQGLKISFQITNLIDELKRKASQFEKDTIKSDLATLKTNWDQTKGQISSFEKTSIERDLNYLSRLLKKFPKMFKGGKK